MYRVWDSPISNFSSLKYRAIPILKMTENISVIFETLKISENWAPKNQPSMAFGTQSVFRKISACMQHL